MSQWIHEKHLMVDPCVQPYGEAAINHTAKPPYAGGAIRQSRPLTFFPSCRINAYTSALFLSLKFYDTRSNGKKRIILAHSHIHARLKLRSPLANNNAPRLNYFPAILFNA